MVDSQLIHALARDDTAALSRIIDRYTGYVATVIHNQLGTFASREDTEELTANVFVSLWQNRGRLKTPRLRGWLAATALAVGLLQLDARRGEVYDPETLPAMEGYVALPPEVQPPEDIVYTNVNAVGTTDSPEYQAAQEWTDWCLAHQEENTLFPGGIENYTQAELDEIWTAMDNDVYARLGANTDEARAALDAIAAKYGLRIPASFREVYAKDLFDMTGRTDFLPLNGSARAGTWYEGGSLSITNSAALENGRTVNYDLIRSVRGMFSKPAQLVLERDITEEWEYTAADGTAVTLDLGPNRSALMAELPNSFLYVHIRGGTENSDLTRDFTGPDTLTRADLEAFADLIDFGTLDSIE